MRPLLAPDEMARADEAAIAGGISAEVLMERAGRAVAAAALRLARGRYGRRAAVVCGPGNNGGDGFVAARVLAREGLGVRCLSVAGAHAAKGAARHHLERLGDAGVALEPFDPGRLEGAGVVIDAIFGTGFRGEASGEPAAAIEAINECGAPVVAVDVPSGVDGTTGTVSGAAVRAGVTVAMAAEKQGSALSQGAVHAGRVEVADIGIAIEGATAWVSEAADAASVLPARRPDSHKRSGGAVALLGGSAGMSGAPLLACRGAVRMGAGYATLGATEGVDAAKQVLLPEVLSEVVSDGPGLGPDALDRFGPVLGRADALALGPGLGVGEGQRGLVGRVLGEVDLPLVLDADGLNVLAGDAGALRRRARATVITPHPAELGRLVDDSVDAIQRDRLGAARRAAAELGCIVLLKGWRTVVAEPSGAAVVNPTGGAELATAGTGDVLTGAVAALIAAGAAPFEAAWAAAFVHGRAGSICGRTKGFAALAWDVAEALPEALLEVLEAAGRATPRRERDEGASGRGRHGSRLLP
jgi:hydroxyethylthiazole kinase-like uncharacterized protein yjeF